MKIRYINWDKVDPGTIFGIKNIFAGLYSSDMVEYKYYYYFIKYDDILNELVFYNMLDERLERINLKSDLYDYNYNEMEFDILSGIYSYFDKPNYRYLKEKQKLSKNHLVIFKDTLLSEKKSEKYEFFKITNLKGNKCELESISKGFKLKNIDINSITSPSKIFKFKKERIIEVDKFINSERIEYKSRNYNLILKLDKCHRNIFVLVYKDIIQKYSIESFKPDILVEKNSLNYSNSIINDYIEKKINDCIDSIEIAYSYYIPIKGTKYKRINYKTNRVEEVKFNLKNISCFYDLYFENLFKSDQEIYSYEKERIKNSINSSSIFYK